MAIFSSPTQQVPDSPSIPRHVAIIMDGNGRWAKQRYLPRVAGHRKGADALRATIRRCVQRGVEYLTVFAFSVENWRVPAEDIGIWIRSFHSAREQKIS